MKTTLPILTHEERIGTLLADKYRIESILGRGGMGAVFGGRHEWTGRRVAVKLLNHEIASEPEMAERFLREARTAAGLKHPNVVDVLDMGRDADGSVYLVLERLEGSALADMLAAGPLSPEMAFRVLIPVMRALAFAHKRNVVHRDLKPDNIFITEDAEGTSVSKLLDFGIAKIVENNRTSVTRTGAVLGTPDYMSPEQARGDADVGPPSDVWSMGVVWFECLTGLLPFNGTGPSALIIAIATTRAPSIATVAPAMHPTLVATIDRALLPNARDRWPDMTAFVTALLEAGAAMGIVSPSDIATSRATNLPLDTGANDEFDKTDIAASITRLPVSNREEPLPLSTPRASVADSRSSTKLSWVGASSAPKRNRRVGLLVAGGVIAVAALTFGGLAFMHRSSTTAPVSPAIRATVQPAPMVVVAPSPAPPIVAPVEAPSPAIAPAIVAPVAPANAPVAAHPLRANTAPPSVATIAPPPVIARPTPAIAPTPIAPVVEPPPAPVAAPAPVPVAAPAPPAVHDDPAPNEAPVHHTTHTPAPTPPPAHGTNAPLTDYE